MVFKDAAKKERRTNPRYRDAFDWSSRRISEGRLDVKRVQMTLERLGYLKKGEYKASVFDMETFQAICRFQEKAGFKGKNVDGKWGNMTNGAADRAIARLERQEKMAAVPARKTGPYVTPEAFQALLTRIVNSNSFEITKRERGRRPTSYFYTMDFVHDHYDQMPTSYTDYYDYTVKVDLGRGASLEITLDSTTELKNDAQLKAFLLELIGHNGTTNAGYIANIWLVKGPKSTALFRHDAHRQDFTAFRLEAGPKKIEPGRQYFEVLYAALERYDPAKKGKG